MTIRNPLPTKLALRGIRRVLLLAAIAPVLFAAAYAAGQAPSAPQKEPSSSSTARPSQGLTQGSRTSVVSVEANLQLFATLCALQAAGFEREVSDAGFHPVRRRFRSHLLSLQGPATDALRRYVSEHRGATQAATLSQYVSFALVAGPPPQFRYVLRRDELPPDVLPIADFNDVLAAFFEEAQIERLWAQVQTEYDREIMQLTPVVTQQAQQLTGYLRELLDSRGAGRFIVVIEPLVGAQTNFRSYRNDYYLVLGSRPEPPVAQIRYAFLHFLLDPLPLRYPNAVEAKRPLLEIGARAPRLPTTYKERASGTLSAWVTQCLVKAVEIRITRLKPDQLAAALEETDRDGYVLVRPLVRELQSFEQAEPAMSLYYADLLRRVRVSEETKRLEGVQFAAASPAPAEDTEKDAQPDLDAELEQWLFEGDHAIAAKDAATAAAAFDRVLAKYPELPRGTYGRAVAAVLQGDVERAKEMFRALLRRSDDAAERPDPLILAWSHVFLGRIYDVEGNRELARSEFQAALAVEGAPENARLAARRGLEKGSQPSTSNPPGLP